MTFPLARRIFAVGVALAAGMTVSAEETPVGRDLVMDVPDRTVRLRVVMMIDGKPIAARQAALVESLPQADGDAAATSEMPTMEIVVQPSPLVDRLELFTALDADESGFITASEFGDSERLFAYYDADGDGTLSQPELAPTEPLQPMPVRSGADFPPGRFPFHWEAPHGEADAVVEIKLIGRAFGRPKILVSGGEKDGDEGGNATHSSPLTIKTEPRKASVDIANVALDLDAKPARITSEDVKRFYMLQLLQRDADKNGYLDESEFLGLGLPGLDFKTADANGDGMLFRDELRARLDDRIARETSRVRIEATYERQPLFTKLDIDGDARLSRRELRHSQQAMSAIDSDGDGRIGLAEFGGRYRLSFSVPNLLDGANPQMVAQIEAMPRGPSPRAAEGPAWFAAMDRNFDGDLVRREFLGTAETFATIDTDGDGLIGPDEANAAEQTQQSKRKIPKPRAKRSVESNRPTSDPVPSSHSPLVPQPSSHP